MTSSFKLSDSWQMHQYYIFNKYFAKKVMTLSLYQKSFIKNNIVNKIKYMCWFNYKIVIGSQKKTSKCWLNFNLNQINSWCINYNQYIQNKIKTNYAMKAISYACFKLEEEATGSGNKNKNNFIDVMGDKLAMGIKWGKLTIPFCNARSCSVVWTIFGHLYK